MNIFETNGKTFDFDTSFPPIDEKNIQNAVMIAPYDGQMYVFGWGCYNYTGDLDGDVWEWEPLFPLSSGDGMELIHLIERIRKGLGL